MPKSGQWLLLFLTGRADSPRKKMQKKSESRVNGNTSYAQQLAEIKYYTPPVLRETKNGWYVEFYAFDPSIGKPGRKRVKINRIKSVSERRKYAKSLMRRISERLAVGWNPFVNNVGSEDYLTFEEICDKYSLDIEKKFSQGIYREETYRGLQALSLRTGATTPSCGVRGWWHEALSGGVPLRLCCRRCLRRRERPYSFPPVFSAGQSFARRLGN